MKKKLPLLAIGLAYAVVSLGLLLGGGAGAAQTVNAETASAEYYGNVSRSAGLYEQAVSPYITKAAEPDGKEITVYSGDYGGVFIDEQGLLNIGVVASDAQIRALQEASRFGGQVLYRRYAFAYNELQRIMDAVEGLMFDCGISAVGIDDELNHVFVELTDESNVPRIVTHLQELGLYREAAVIFGADPNMGIQTQAGDNAYGGEAISYTTKTSISAGTVCVNAVDNATGKIGVLTNEHVARDTDDLTAPIPYLNYRGHYVSGQTYTQDIGLGTRAKGKMGDTVDAAFVPFSTPKKWGITPYARHDTTTYSNVKLGNDNQIISGQPIMRIGQVSGISPGTIKSTNVTGNIKGVQIKKTFHYTNEGRNGDSGGPVYFDDGTDLHLIGMHFGSGQTITGAWRGYACRMSEVMRELDVTPLLNDTMYHTIELPGDNLRIEFVKYVLPDGVHELPGDIYGKTVTEIGGAFFGKAGLAGVTIPETVTSIGTQAFMGCTKLKSIELPSPLTYIGAHAFNGTGLTSVIIPYGVESVGTLAFYNCGSLEKVYFAPYGNLQSIGVNAFGMCDKLDEIYGLPFIGNGSNVTDLGYLFGVSNANIPPSLKTVSTAAPVIGDYAFCGCQHLERVVLWEGVVSVGNYAFYDCASLTSVDVRSTVAHIGHWAFAMCCDLQIIALPDSLTGIGEYAFLYCGNLTKITISASVAYIGGYAFFGCNYLTIHAEAPGKPSGWDNYWNASNCPVVWGGGGVSNHYTGASVRHAFTAAGTQTITFTPAQSGDYKFHFCDIDCCRPNTISVSGGGVSANGSCSLKASLAAGQTYTVTFTATPCGSKTGWFKIDKCC